MPYYILLCIQLNIIFLNIFYLLFCVIFFPLSQFIFDAIFNIIFYILFYILLFILFPFNNVSIPTSILKFILYYYIFY